MKQILVSRHFHKRFPSLSTKAKNSILANFSFHLQLLFPQNLKIKHQKLWNWKLEEHKEQHFQDLLFCFQDFALIISSLFTKQLQKHNVNMWEEAEWLNDQSSALWWVSNSHAICTDKITEIKKFTIEMSEKKLKNLQNDSTVCSVVGFFFHNRKQKLPMVL